MHSAYFSNCASVGPDWPEELEPAGALGWVVVVLALPRLATPLCAGPPPQAVTRKLKAASTARTATGRVVALVTCLVSHACGQSGRVRLGATLPAQRGKYSAITEPPRS